MPASYFISIAKDKSPDTLIELNLGLCMLLETSIVSCVHIIHLIVLT